MCRANRGQSSIDPMVSVCNLNLIINTNLVCWSNRGLSSIYCPMVSVCNLNLIINTNLVCRADRGPSSIVPMMSV